MLYVGSGTQGRWSISCWLAENAHLVSNLEADTFPLPWQCLVFARTSVSSKKSSVFGLMLDQIFLSNCFTSCKAAPCFMHCLLHSASDSPGRWEVLVTALWSEELCFHLLVRELLLIGVLLQLALFLQMHMAGLPLREPCWCHQDPCWRVNTLKWH